MAYLSIFYIAIVFMFSFGYRQNQPHALINYICYSNVHFSKYHNDQHSQDLCLKNKFWLIVYAQFKGYYFVTKLLSLLLFL